MADKPKGFSLRVTRKQGVLIAVLGIALADVMIQGMSGGVTENESSISETVAARRKKPAEKPAQVSDLRRVSLPVERMIQQNPFAKLAEPPKPAPPKVETPKVPVTVSLPTPRPEEIAAKKRLLERQRKIQETITELQGQKVKIVLRTEKKTSAVIGNRLVSEGDVINGVRVVSILPTGVIVKPVAADSAPQ